MSNIYITNRLVYAKHAIFECSTVCLPVIFELLPGLIPFNTSNSYLTAMYENNLHNNTYKYFSLMDSSQKTVVYVEGINFV